MIRKATEQDISAVEKVYNEVLDHEEKTISYTNWKKGLYPTKAVAEKAFKEGTLFVDEDEETKEITGAVILNYEQPVEYKKLNWSIEAEGEEVLVIHTLCIRPSFARRKLGEKFVAFAEEHGRKLKCKTIRLDTYEGNIPGAALYTKTGYNYVGSTDFFFQNLIEEVLKCFDKVL